MTPRTLPRGSVPLSRRRFPGLSAGGGATGSNSVTIMANEGDITDELIAQPRDELGISITVVLFDVTRLTAMLASGQPPDLVRGLGALDTPYLVAREVAEELDPYFAQSAILKVDDLDPVNDLWRFDGQRQGRGPIYGMAKDYSQDSIYCVLVTLSSAWAGYGFARLSPPGKKPLFGLLLSTMMLPQMITLIPTYLLFAELNMVNTYWPWVLWGLAGTPYLIFLFRQFFAGLPKELEEAAIVDGCGYTSIFFRIFLPPSWPAIAASLVISFAWSWGDFLAPMLLLNRDTTTLAVALSTSFVNDQGFPINNLMAAGAVMYMLPPLLLFFVAQRGFIAGSPSLASSNSRVTP
jgi:ABC-type spermidine/putrescine transport system permease subunit II